jgi:hypothetical protein
MGRMLPRFLPFPSRPARGQEGKSRGRARAIARWEMSEWGWETGVGREGLGEGCWGARNGKTDHFLRSYHRRRRQPSNSISHPLSPSFQRDNLNCPLFDLESRGPSPAARPIELRSGRDVAGAPPRSTSRNLAGHTLPADPTSGTSWRDSTTRPPSGPAATWSDLSTLGLVGQQRSDVRPVGRGEVFEGPDRPAPPGVRFSRRCNRRTPAAMIVS